MIKGIGIDIVYLSTIQSLLDAQTEGSLRDVFTENEIDLCRASPNALERFATRFAAKEATMKALGLGWEKGGIDWTDIEVVSDEHDKPLLKLGGEAQVKAESMGVQAAWLSLTHEENIGIAMVVLEN